MTHIPEFLPMTDDDPLARRAFFMAFEGMGYLTSPVRSRSWSASTFVKQQGRHGYARHTVSLDGGPIVTSKGVTIETLPLAEFDGAAMDTIVVPGALDMEPALSNRRLVDWLAFDFPKARRTASVCAGAIPVGRSRSTLRNVYSRGCLGKALSIVARRDCQYSEERTTHLLFAAEAATFSNRFDSIVRFLKPATRCVNSDRFHRLCGGASALRCIEPCEVSGAHVHTVRKSIDAEVALQMLHYPAFQFAERLRVGFRLGSKQCAVLRLPTGPFQINDQDTCNIHRERAPGVLLDQGER